MFAIEQLEKKINSEEPQGIYLLYGEEQFLLENSLKKIKNKFGETLKGINYITIDETNVNGVISDIETPAFGFEKKLIIIKNSGLLKKEGKRKNAELTKLKDKVNQYFIENIKLINKSCVIIFIEEDVEKLNLYKTIEKIGTVCEFEFQKPQVLMQRLKSICNLYKVNIDNSTLNYLIEVCGTNMQELINEIRKLIEYVGENGTIKKEDIDTLTIKKLESVIFDLTDNLGKRNIGEAIQVLNNLIYSKEPIQKILITLYNHFKKLYLAKIANENNKNVATSLKLKPNQTFLVNKYLKQASYFKKNELKEILQQLRDLDYNYKIGLIDVQIGLESILCAYC